MIDAEPTRTRANEGIDDDLTVDELKFVLESLPCDEHGLPRLDAISDRELRARFEEVARRKAGQHGDA